MDLSCPGFPSSLYPIGRNEHHRHHQYQTSQSSIFNVRAVSLDSMPGSSSKKSSKKGDKPKKGDKANKAQAELAAQKAARKEQARTWQIVDPRTLEANTIYIAMRRYNVWAHEGDESYVSIPLYSFQRSIYIRNDSFEHCTDIASSFTASCPRDRMANSPDL